MTTELRIPEVITPHEEQSILAIIERASVNPAVDIDKMERLLEMHERMVNRQAEQSFNIAMSRAQAAMGQVSADASNSQTKSKYASYAAIDRVLRPIYAREGFALSFDTGETPQPEMVRVLCHVSHQGGHTRTYHADMPADGKGAKGGDVMTKTHATGAGMTYGMRYLLKMIFNVAVGEGDTDGNITFEVDQNLQTLEQAKTPDELLKDFTTFYSAAKNAKNNAAMGEYIKAYEKRKKELK